jgi:ABC-type Zn2+ transport system substrate-binding protein/surface adhesin
VLSTFLDFSLPYISIIAGVAVTILAIRFLLEKSEDELEGNHGHQHFKGGEHTHTHSHAGIGIHTHKYNHPKLFLSLSSIAVFAFILGFAHEEEFALLALAIGGINPLILMLTYSIAVMED